MISLAEQIARSPTGVALTPRLLSRLGQSRTPRRGDGLSPVAGAGRYAGATLTRLETEQRQLSLFALPTP